MNNKFEPLRWGEDKLKGLGTVTEKRWKERGGNRVKEIWEGGGTILLDWEKLTKKGVN